MFNLASLNTSLSLLLNLLIILAAAYFSAQAAIILGAFGLLILLLRSLALAKFIFPAAFLLLATASICYLYYLKLSSLCRNLERELENIEEGRNVLSAELKHLRLLDSTLKQKVLRYATLKGLAEILSSTFSFDKIASLITSEALRIIGKSDACLLYLVDKEKQRLHLADTKAKGASLEATLKNGDVYERWVFKQRIPLLVEDAARDFRFNIQEAARDRHNVRSLIAAPLISGQNLLGILRLDNASARVYDADDLRLLKIVCDLSAAATVNSLLYKETERLAITDGLTGLLLHRYFHQRFEEEISRTLWTNSRFAFLMLDIDNFKNYNDQYGHIAGDIILKKVAGLIKSGVNAGDIVARYGGEEFGVLLVDTHRAAALKIAEELRERVEKEQFTLRRQPTRVSISGGVAFFPQDGKAKESLIQRADQALYKAKREGKNKICTS